MYCLSCVRPWPSLYHEAWVDNMRIFKYHPCLQQQSSCENYCKLHDIFLGRMVYELKGNIHKRFLDEAMQLIGTYGSFLIQFPKFSYLRVGDFEG